MRFDLLTLFPELVQPQLEIGITRRAFASGQVQVRCWNPRDFTEDNYRRVDDRPFGGGPGMVMLVEPLERALAAAQADRASPAPVIHFSPAGERLTQALVAEIAAEFLRSQNPARERAFIAERAGQVVGSTICSATSARSVGSAGSFPSRRGSARS